MFTLTEDQSDCTRGVDQLKLQAFHSPRMTKIPLSNPTIVINSSFINSHSIQGLALEMKKVLNKTSSNRLREKTPNIINPRLLHLAGRESIKALLS